MSEGHPINCICKAMLAPDPAQRTAPIHAEARGDVPGGLSREEKVIQDELGSHQSGFLP